MKSFVLLLTLLFSTLVVHAQNSPNAKIVLIKGITANDVNSVYVEVNDMLITLKKRSYYELFVAPGTYTVLISGDVNNAVQVEVNDGETVYLIYKFSSGVFSSTETMVPILNPKDGESFTRGLTKLSREDIMPEIKMNRISGLFSFGFAFQSTDMVELEGGGTSSIGTGGGVGFGLTYGRRLTQNIEVLTLFMYQFDFLSPEVSNADVQFNRFVLSVTPTYLINLNKFGSRAIALGAGVDAFFNPNMTLDLSELPGGFKETWTYKNTWGYHLHLAYLSQINEKSLVEVSARLNVAAYEFERAKNGNLPSLISNRLINPNGNGLNFYLKYSRLF